MSFQVFFGPMPMKEKMLVSLPLRAIATALLESGIGRGESLGGSAARRVEIRKLASNSAGNLFIGEMIAVNGFPPCTSVSSVVQASNSRGTITHACVGGTGAGVIVSKGSSTGAAGGV